MLNRKSLADLACWEPHSFKALTDVAKQTAAEQNLDLFYKFKAPKVIMPISQKKKK